MDLEFSPTPRDKQPSALLRASQKSEEPPSRPRRSSRLSSAIKSERDREALRRQREQTSAMYARHPRVQQQKQVPTNRNFADPMHQGHPSNASRNRGLTASVLQEHRRLLAGEAETKKRNGLKQQLGMQNEPSKYMQEYITKLMANRHAPHISKCLKLTEAQYFKCQDIEVLQQICLKFIEDNLGAASLEWCKLVLSLRDERFTAQAIQVVENILGHVELVDEKEEVINRATSLGHRVGLLETKKDDVEVGDYQLPGRDPDATVSRNRQLSEAITRPKKKAQPVRGRSAEYVKGYIADYEDTDTTRGETYSSSLPFTDNGELDKWEDVMVADSLGVRIQAQMLMDQEVARRQERIFHDMTLGTLPRTPENEDYGNSFMDDAAPAASRRHPVNGSYGVGFDDEKESDGRLDDVSFPQAAYAAKQGERSVTVTSEGREEIIDVDGDYELDATDEASEEIMKRLNQIKYSMNDSIFRCEEEIEKTAATTRSVLESKQRDTRSKTVTSPTSPMADVPARRVTISSGTVGVPLPSYRSMKSHVNAVNGIRKFFNAIGEKPKNIFSSYLYAGSGMSSTQMSPFANLLTQYTQRPHSLLHALRKDDIATELLCCPVTEFCDYLPLVIYLVASMPFGLAQYRSRIVHNLAQRIDGSRRAQQILSFIRACHGQNPKMSRVILALYRINDETHASSNSDEQRDHLTTPSGSGHNSNSDNSRDTGHVNNPALSAMHPSHESRARRMSVNVFQDSHYFYISFWRNVLEASEMQQFGCANRRVEIMDLFHHTAPALHRIEITDRWTEYSSSNSFAIADCQAKVVSSTSPRTESGVSEVTISRIVLTSGLDVRNGVSCMYLFELCNDIWCENDVSYYDMAVNIACAKCVAFNDTKFGAFELSTSCVPLANMKQSIPKGWSTAKSTKLFSTAVATLVGCFLVSGSTVDFDSALLSVVDGTMVILASTVHMNVHDTKGDDETSLFEENSGEFSGLGKIKNVLSDRWGDFIQVAVDLFLILRRHYLEIVEFAQLVFGFQFRPSEIEYCFEKRFLVELTEEQAMVQMMSTFSR